MKTQLKQQVPWKAQFLASHTNSLSIDDNTVFDNALQKPWEKNWNSEFLNSQWEDKFERVSKALDQHSLEKSWENQFKQMHVENDIDWNEKFKDIFGFNESKSEWTTDL
jgi:hypothetical protein